MAGAIATTTFRHSPAAQRRARQASLLPGGVNLCPDRAGLGAVRSNRQLTLDLARRIVESSLIEMNPGKRQVDLRQRGRERGRLLEGRYGEIRAPLVEVLTCERLRQGQCADPGIACARTTIGPASNRPCRGDRCIRRWRERPPRATCTRRQRRRRRRSARTRRRAAGGLPAHRASDGRPASIPQWPLLAEDQREVPASNRAG